MTKLEVFDPPMCCTTGICGSSADQTLVAFASDLEWLKKQGVDVIRHGLSFEPSEFVSNEKIKRLINQEGNRCLPIIVVDDKLISRSVYPTREDLAQMCKIEFNEDEAPPVHREENCCCGVDCDCRSANMPEGISIKPECNCSNAAAEDNCYCESECDCKNPPVITNFQKIFFIVLLVVMLTIIAAKYCCKARGENLHKNPASISQINQNVNLACQKVMPVILRLQV